MEDSSLQRIQFSVKPKISKLLFILLLLLFTGCVFYLDMITGDKITFYVFYFPSILMATWKLGARWGWLTVALSAVLWAIAQQGIKTHEGEFLFFWNAAVRAGTFAAICWMTLLIRDREQKLEEKTRELARSNKELEHFAFGAAHDLQSPLATIHGFVELLDEKIRGTGDKDSEECIARIEKSIKRMSAFIKALLHYSRVMTKEAPAVPVSLGDIVRGTLGELHFSILEKKAVVTVGPLPTLPVSPELIGTLFQNLIDNALKYCEQEPKIHITAVPQGKEWVFSVRDNGIGIPQADQERIFVLFEKVLSDRKYPGHGIGLATCQKIVERYHGRLWVESPPKAGAGAEGQGTGSVFYFTLPAG